jgi:GR25 family glycosyltransferase involved in LPS biosynthesis
MNIKKDKAKEIIGNIPIYWINLENSTDRKIILENHFEDYGILNQKRVNAINSLSPEIEKYKMNTKISSNELACTLSHIKAIQQAYDDGCENAIIIEDDANFNYILYQTASISDLANQYNKFELIQLCQTVLSERFINNIKLNFGVHPGYCWGAVGYYISRIGMKIIIDNILKNEIFVADASIYSYCSVGYVNKPYITYYYTKDISTTIHNLEWNFDYPNNSKKMWDNYYKVTSKWDKIYCINKCTDLKKYKNMQKYRNLLNDENNDFYYDEILSSTIPNLDFLIDIEKFHKSTANAKCLSDDQISKCLTIQNIIKEAYERKYDYILLLEDTIKFNDDYSIILGDFFDKYPEFDILNLGCYNYENADKIFETIDTISNYDICIPKKNENKICVGGMFSVILSKKAIGLFNNNYNQINTIYDILLYNLSWQMNCDFSMDNKLQLANFNNKQEKMKSYFFNPNFFSNDYNNVEFDPYTIDTLLEKKINYLSKNKIINYKNEYNKTINIFVTNNVKQWYTVILKKICKNYNNINFDCKINECDICIYNITEIPTINNKSLNICFSGEKENHFIADINIQTTKKQGLGFVIYYPHIFVSLDERRKDYKNIPKRIKTKFCAYMYSYNVPYRVDLFNSISKYKKVDALGKSCNEELKYDDRYVYNNEITYNDIAVDKYAEYKFVLALENIIIDSYVTEKIINPIFAHSIPIYAGPIDAFEIINKKRVIYVYDFDNFDDLNVYIKKIDENEILYEEIVNEPIFAGDWSFEKINIYIDSKIKQSLGQEKKIININSDQTLDLTLHFDKNITNEELERYISGYISK